jgi:hypothetical protein
MNTYATEIDPDNLALRCIVGTAEWATVNLGSTWIGTDYKVGIGWMWDGSGFVAFPVIDMAPDLPED